MLTGLISVGPLGAEESLSFLRGTLTGSGFETVFPTALTVGPDGRLFVADQEGRIQALTLDADGIRVVAVEMITEDADIQEIFGIAFDVSSPDSPTPLYVSNTVSGFGVGGRAPAGEFSGRVTRIDGANYSQITDVITGLPISNSSHQTNGLAFDGSGVLYIAQGSTTNAGVPNMVGNFLAMDEVPLSSCILQADINAMGFDGVIVHNPPNTYGHTVDLVSGDVSPFAVGFRNPYDLLFHSNGRLYVTDNGPNEPFGLPSIDCTTDGVVGAQGPDELNIAVAGDYYGHANRNRGRTDVRQCTFRLSSEPSDVDYTAPIAVLPSSSNGIVEYTSGTAFCGALQGDLLYVAYNQGTLRRVVLSGDGSAVVSDDSVTGGFNLPLDVAVGSNGILYVAEYGGSQISFLRPHDCKEGNVNAAVGPVTDVLFANGSPGSLPDRTVCLGVTDPLTLSLVSPPSRMGQTTPFCIWANVGSPTSSSLRELPLQLGYVCMPNELTGETSNRRTNNLGSPVLLGADDWPGPLNAQAPTDILTLAGGVGFPVTFQLQGILLDSDSLQGQAAVTNSVVIEVK